MEGVDRGATAYVVERLAALFCWCLFLGKKQEEVVELELEAEQRKRRFFFAETETEETAVKLQEAGEQDATSAPPLALGVAGLMAFCSTLGALLPLTYFTSSLFVSLRLDRTRWSSIEISRSVSANHSRARQRSNT